MAVSEREKMLAGALYDPSDQELSALRRAAHRLCKEFNDTPEEEANKREEILDSLLPARGEGTELMAPVFLDYGIFTEFGTCCYANFNLTILDCCPVKIGNNVFFGPNCSLVTPLHPLLPKERNMKRREDGSFWNLEYAKPIVIGDDCWLGTGVTVCGGVTIGAGTVIGAGSVVTRDIPAGVFAAGVPCRVVRALTEADEMA